MIENTNSSGMLSLPEDIVVGLLNNSAEELKRSRRSRILGRVWKIVMVVGFFAAAYFIGASKVSPIAGNSHEPHIASATDEIYVDQASIVGSIGVITSSFGFSEIMNKVGVERRVLTAGENKALLNPYLPLDPKVKVHWQTMLDNIHEQFITAVKEGRKGKLDDAGPEVFSGMVWTGEDSVKVGLADGTGSLMSVSRDTLGRVNTVNYTPAPDLFKRFANGTQAALTSMQIQMSAPSLY